MSIYDKILSECFLVLYPNGDGKDLKPTDLPMYIKQLREDMVRLNELAVSEVEKRHAVEKNFMREAELSETRLKNLQMYCDMAEQKAIEMEDKIRIMELCFEGLFGKKGETK